MEMCILTVDTKTISRAHGARYDDRRAHGARYGIWEVACAMRMAVERREVACAVRMAVERRDVACAVRMAVGSDVACAVRMPVERNS